MCHQGLGFWRAWTYIIYPKDHSWKPQQWLEDCPAWSHGTRRGILSGPCFDLGRVSSLTVSPSILSSCHSCPLQTYRRNDTCTEPSTTPGVLAMTFGLLHSAGNTAGNKGVQAVGRKDLALKSWAGLDNCIPFHTFPAFHTLAHQYASVTSSNSALKGNATFQREWSISLTLPVNMFHQGVTNMLLLPHCQRWCHYQAW